MRGRRSSALLAAGVLAVVGAGCGGGDSGAPQVPGPPAGMPLPPEGSAPPEGSGTDESTTDPSAEPTPEEPAVEPDATAEPAPVPPADESGTAAPAEPETAAAPEEVGGGTVAPEAAADGPANDTPPPAGSDAEQFEDFCAQNPGAC